MHSCSKKSREIRFFADFDFFDLDQSFSDFSEFQSITLSITCSLPQSETKVQSPIWLPWYNTWGRCLLYIECNIVTIEMTIITWKYAWELHPVYSKNIYIIFLLTALHIGQITECYITNCSVYVIVCGVTYHSYISYVKY